MLELVGLPFALFALMSPCSLRLSVALPFG
jgi:hypothetical protein